MNKNIAFKLLNILSKLIFNGQTIIKIKSLRLSPGEYFIMCFRSTDCTGFTVVLKKRQERLLDFDGLYSSDFFPYTSQLGDGDFRLAIFNICKFCSEIYKCILDFKFHLFVWEFMESIDSHRFVCLLLVGLSADFVHSCSLVNDFYLMVSEQHVTVRILEV